MTQLHLEARDIIALIVVIIMLAAVIILGKYPQINLTYTGVLK